MTTLSIAEPEGRLAYAVSLPPAIAFTLTENNLREGGRPRDPLEVYLNVNQERAAYLGEDPLTCVPEDGAPPFEARISGHHGPAAGGPKNLRSRPATALGEWLKLICRALPGDVVHAAWRPDRTLGLRFERRPGNDAATAARRLEREHEDWLCHELQEAGVPFRRQVPVASGVIDVLAPDALYEVKSQLSRSDLLHGLGQLLVYRAQCADGDGLRLVLVGRRTAETEALLPTLAKLGVEVRPW